MQEESPKDVTAHCQASVNELPTEFPRTVERILSTGSSMTTMDFHPVHEDLLLGCFFWFWILLFSQFLSVYNSCCFWSILSVGKYSGDVEIWDVAAAVKVFKREFVGTVMSNQAKMEKDHGITVNRVLWSPDGSLFGMRLSLKTAGYFCQRPYELLISYPDFDNNRGCIFKTTAIFVY